MSNYYFFFFQAEDGIRDADVTGVQTCALPICRRPGEAALLRRHEHAGSRGGTGDPAAFGGTAVDLCPRLAPRRDDVAAHLQSGRFFWRDRADFCALLDRNT